MNDCMSLNLPHKRAENLGYITLNMLQNLQRLNVRNWLAKELSDDHWLNVNEDTVADISLGLSKGK